MEPVTTALAGIALVKKSVDFIKENISTAQDIGELVGHVEKAFQGSNECIKAREGKDQFATENIAQEVIDAKLAQEHLYELSQLINHRFGHGTWQYILDERKKRIRDRKQKLKEIQAKKLKKQKEMMEIVSACMIGIAVVIVLCMVGYGAIILL